MPIIILAALAAVLSSAGCLIITDNIATAVALVLRVRQRRLLKALAAVGRDRGASSGARRATRAERRLLATSLRSTMRLVAMTTLLPETSARATRLSEWS